MAEKCDKSNSHKKGAWITIGSFDGIHVGHKKIINKLVDGSNQEKASSVVVTFFPHPAIQLRKITTPFYLTPPEEKDYILSEFGVDSILTLNFDHAVSRLSPRDFISPIHNQLDFSCLLIGFDFRMGADRVGDLHKLTELGEEMGFCVQAIAPVLFHNQPVSSSRIRTALINGDLTTANMMLGYPYSIEGVVVHGDGRGQHIGLPTANLAIWGKKLLPASGVYAAYAEVNNTTQLSVVSIGYRPTFYENPTLQTIEAHILDFSNQIYDRQIKIKLIARLRPEEKYNSVGELMNQIHVDIKKAREVLANDIFPPNISS